MKMRRAIILVMGLATSAWATFCVDCRRKVTPWIVEQHESGKMSKAEKVARLTKEGFQGPRDKMLEICSRCHGASYARDQLEQGDRLARETDPLMAAAIREVQGFYRDGIPVKPEG